MKDKTKDTLVDWLIGGCSGIVVTCSLITFLMVGRMFNDRLVYKEKIKQFDSLLITANCIKNEIRLYPKIADSIMFEQSKKYWKLPKDFKSLRK